MCKAVHVWRVSRSRTLQSDDNTSTNGYLELKCHRLFTKLFESTFFFFLHFGNAMFKLFHFSQAWKLCNILGLFWILSFSIRVCNTLKSTTDISSWYNLYNMLEEKQVGKIKDFTWYLALAIFSIEMLCNIPPETSVHNSAHYRTLHLQPFHLTPKCIANPCMNNTLLCLIC